MSTVFSWLGLTFDVDTGWLVGVISGFLTHDFCFLRLMVSPKAVAALAKHVTILWRASSVCAKRAKSSANSKSVISCSAAGQQSVQVE